MLSEILFLSQVRAIGGILVGAPSERDALRLYYNAVRHLSDERFAQVCGCMVAELEFFPKPVWVIDRASQLANAESMQTPALPFAEVAGSTCPDYVRAWMRPDYGQGRELMQRLRTTRKQIRFALEKQRIQDPALTAQVEAHPEVVTIKTELDRRWRRNDHIDWDKTTAHDEMQAFKAELEAGEVYEFEFEVDPPALSIIRDEEVAA